MSAPSSPGWTWSLLPIERWMLVCPSASAAALFRRRRRGFDLSGLDRPRSPAFYAHPGNEDDSRRQRSVERLDDWKLGSFLDSVSVNRLRQGFGGQADRL